MKSVSSDALLGSTAVEDALAQLYVESIATKAGYVISKKNFDLDGVDLTLEAGGGMRPKIDIQLKATINLKEIGRIRDRFSYQCPKRNHDLLRIQTQTPRILVVLRLPREEEKWLSIHPHHLVLRHSAYWVSLWETLLLTTEKKVRLYTY